MPLCPCGVKTRGLADHGGVGLGESQAQVLGEFGGGSGLPCHFWSPGLGSKRSIWLGPPSMNMKMTFLALGGKCGLRGASGFCSTRGGAPFAFQHLRQRDRADSARAFAEETCGGSEFYETVPGPWLIPRNELVQVQEHTAQLHPGGGFGLWHAL